MICLKFSRNYSRIFKLVGLALGECDRESFNRLVHHLAHHGGNGRRIYPARKKHAERHVRHQTQAHGFAEKLSPLCDVIFIARALIAVIFFREMYVPVFFNLHLAVAPAQSVTGQQSLDAAKERLFSARRVICQIVRQGAEV